MPAARSVVAREPAGPRPFVKWVGGKRQILPEIRRHMPATYGRYYEPFLGGGAVFFHLRPEQAVLTDSNERLIRAYKGVQKNVGAVIRLLQSYQGQHNKRFFLRMRANHDIDTGDDAEVAAWFIYLNRTGYNGLYRVNSQNVFNVPFGTYTRPKICDEDNLRACSQVLRHATVGPGGFETAVGRAKKGDFVYFDPPYVPLNSTSSFTDYTSRGFDAAEQVKLRDVALQLKRRGVFVLLSNSSAPLVRSLYKEPDFTVVPVAARRSVNSNPKGRGNIQELLIK